MTLLAFPSPSPHAARSDRQLLRSMGIRVRWWERIQRKVPAINLKSPLTFSEVLKTLLIIFGAGGIFCGLWVVAWMGVATVMGLMGLVK